ncbi:MAG TPA: shikimate kinase [Gemmatimonadaceae bacterium]|jgi:shikimate kinase|nr:shikimate kinase [Gemmatimonadaceae bacterium]
MTPTFRTSHGVSAADPSVPHLILVGLPGSGKSVVGMRAAEIAQRSFLDFDAEIERREGRSIASIFAESGEFYFREKERALTEELRELGGMILSPGGGWITNPDVVSLLRPPGVLVYLKARPETALKRMGRRQALRPLLAKPDPLGEIRALYARRRVLYEGADVVMDTEALALQQVTEQVVALVEKMR